MPDGCPLCNMEKKTEWKYEDDICIIARCLSDNQWMLVFKFHRWPTVAEMLHALGVITRLFGNIKVRTRHGQIIEHCHWHLIGA